MLLIALQSMTAYKLLYSRAIAFKFHGVEAIKKNRKAPDVCGVGGRVGGGKILRKTLSFIVTSGSSTQVLHSRFYLFKIVSQGLLF